ncbi:hypothetical protein [Fulvivirga sp. M361]|uniref:hypothetical protein n=1 Tax=Fulvivirga sp. M361 TaxID=2594266 RepID=UPI0016250F10|nr:hypothetical protein [Fulvivirga sp. M361]
MKHKKLFPAFLLLFGLIVFSSCEEENITVEKDLNAGAHLVVGDDTEGEIKE